MFHIKKDLRRFKELTTGGTVVMGFNTYKSLPKGALPNRRNIVMTRRHAIKDDRVVSVASSDALHSYLMDNGIQADDVWVIGGARIYKALLPECKELYLTRVNALRTSDAIFPCMESILRKMALAGIENDEEGGLTFSFEHYVSI